MTKLTVVATIIAKDDQIDLVKTELLKLVDISRVEAGCINYDLHQDNDNQALFLFYESWESRELWQNHVGNQHIQEFITATEDALEAFILNEMTPYN